MVGHVLSILFLRFRFINVKIKGAEYSLRPFNSLFEIPSWGDDGGLKCGALLSILFLRFLTNVHSRSGGGYL